MKALTLCTLLLTVLASQAQAKPATINSLSREQRIAAIAAEFGASADCVRAELTKNPNIRIAKVNCGLGAGGPIVQCNDGEHCCRVGVTVWCCPDGKKCDDLGGCED